MYFSGVINKASRESFQLKSEAGSPFLLFEV